MFQCMNERTNERIDRIEGKRERQYLIHSLISCHATHDEAEGGRARARAAAAMASEPFPHFTILHSCSLKHFGRFTMDTIIEFCESLGKLYAMLKQTIQPALLASTRETNLANRVHNGS